ncbi:MAG: chloride channel protein [bacterium]
MIENPSAIARLQRALRGGGERHLVAAALVIGVLSGLGAAVLVKLIDFFARALPAAAPGCRPPAWIIFVPAAGGLLVGPIVTRAAPETRGHGVPEVMLAVARFGGKIRARVAALKALASAISIGSGGSAGREGPIVQIGSAVGSTVGDALGASADLRRMLVACGAAGGIAASFNTPIAGVVFALEIVLRDFAGRAFATVVIASVTASVVARSLLGASAFYEVPGSYTMGSAPELLAYAALGVLAALTARLFIETLYRLEDAFERLPIPASLLPALGGLLLGLLAYFRPEVLGTGHEPIEQALHGQLALGVLAVLVVAKILATSFTLGSGGSGGVFAPSLFVGAMLGGAFGHVVDLLFPRLGVQPGAFAVVGMGAVFAGSTWAALSAILVLFEMTRSYGLILPMMLSCVTAVVTAKRLAPDTIYTRKLLRRGIRVDGPAPTPLAGILVRDVMTRSVQTIDSRMPLPDLLRRIEASGHSGFPVLDPEGRLEGIVSYGELRDAMSRAGEIRERLVAADVMRPAGASISPEANLEEAVQLMRAAGVRRLPVVDPERPGALLGIITSADVVTSLARLGAGAAESAARTT